MTSMLHEGHAAEAVIGVPASEAIHYRRRTRTALAWIWLVARWALLGLALSVPLALGAMQLLDLRGFVVLSGSMEPALSAGDVIIDQSIQAGEAHVGDVITFDSPHGGERITHRVEGIVVRTDVIRFTTRGDANNAAESWRIKPDGMIGRTILDVPKVGHAVNWIRNPDHALIWLVIPAAILGVWELWAIWRPRRREGSQ